MSATETGTPRTDELVLSHITQFETDHLKRLNRMIPWAFQLETELTAMRGERDAAIQQIEDAIEILDGGEMPVYPGDLSHPELIRKISEAFQANTSAKQRARAMTAEEERDAAQEQVLALREDLQTVLNGGVVESANEEVGDKWGQGYSRLAQLAVDEYGLDEEGKPLDKFEVLVRQLAGVARRKGLEEVCVALWPETTIEAVLTMVDGMAEESMMAASEYMGAKAAATFGKKLRNHLHGRHFRMANGDLYGWRVIEGNPRRFLVEMLKGDAGEGTRAPGGMGTTDVRA